jgi:SAM-dependent methyltransferase
MAFDSLITSQHRNRNRLAHTLLGLFHNKARSIEDICVRRNICTNVVERYAGLQIIAQLISRKRPLRVLDVGCSFGLGLMAVNTPMIRTVMTADPLLYRELNADVSTELWGLDITRPSLKWLQSCYLPQYKEDRERLKPMVKRLRRNGSRFRFVVGDALRLGEVPDLKDQAFDIVWTSNTCFEVEGDVRKVEAGIKKLLKRSGAWVHAYYRSGQPALERSRTAGRRAPNDYVIGFYPRQGWTKNALEVLEADSDEARTLRRGEDFDQFFRDYT